MDFDIFVDEEFRSPKKSPSPRGRKSSSPVRSPSPRGRKPFAWPPIVTPSPRGKSNRSPSPRYRSPSSSTKKEMNLIFGGPIGRKYYSRKGTPEKVAKELFLETMNPRRRSSPDLVRKKTRTRSMKAFSA